MYQIHEAVHSITSVAEAAKISPHTIHTWYKRGQMRPGLNGNVASKDLSGGPGVGNKLSGHTAMSIVVAAELVSLNVPTAIACQAGVVFGHSGHTASGWQGDISTDVGRLPGCLFDEIEGENALTFALLEPNEDGNLVQITRVLRTTSFDQAFFYRSSLRGQVVLPLDEPVISAKARLNIERS